jgi:hypothetical protein
MKWLVPISLSAVTALGNTAYADQCAWIDADVAQRAKAILASSPKVIAFCEPCGDTVPGVPAVPERVDILEPAHDFRELAIDGAGIDLAYTFVQTSASEYGNLALLAGCPATGVSASLAIAPETKSGVLIAAGATPVVLPPPAPAPAAMEPAAIASLPQLHVYRTTRYEIPWSVVMLAAGGGFAFGAFATLLIVATRRRRDMRPRAADLR